MDYFPLTIAFGGAFCNRKAELAYLTQNINDLKPTLIVSPRRYGKTSLALNTIQKSKLLYARFDFLSAINEHDIETCLLKGVGEFVLRIESGLKKAIVLAGELFSGLDVKVNYKDIGISIELGGKKEKVAYRILRLLERVDQLATKRKKQVVLFFDEFQRIGEIAQDHAIESVIRQVAQESKSTMFIFSGSNRHLLYGMFNDKNRPLYKMCDRITLERIAPDEYKKYIYHACKITSKNTWSDEVLECIIENTENHPYYMNLLCSRLWKESTVTVLQVKKTWNSILMQERSQVAAELDLLSKNQRKLLTVLARTNGTATPRSREFEMAADMSGATITQALSFLEKRDYVFIDKNNYYRVLDPLIKSVLSEM